MIRLFTSTIVGVVLGIVAGLVYGYQIAPVEYVDSPITNLRQRYQDEYTIMIASGYLVDGDVNAAIDRLRVLGVENIPAYVQDLTERYITNSGNVTDIRKLVSLAEALGRLTPPMENFRQLEPVGGGV